MKSRQQGCVSFVRSQKVLCASVVALLTCLSVNVTEATVFNVTAHPNGGLIRSTGVTETGGVTRLIGSSSAANQGLSNVYFFELPALSNNQFVADAELDFNFDSIGGTFTFNTDLYGLGFVGSSPSMSGSWFFEGGFLDVRTRASLGTGTAGTAALIDDNILTTATSPGHILTSGTTTSLPMFLNSLYADGAVGGDYAVFHFVADQVVSGPTGTLGYRITHSGGAASDIAVLDITVANVPEPSSLMLLGIAVPALLYRRRHKTLPRSTTK